MAAALSGAYEAVEPRPEYVTAARERFLRMTELGLRESLAFEPRPTFIRTARRRFMAAAQRLLAERKPSPWARWAPAIRVAEFAAAVLAIFVLGFGSFAVTTSADALPGDWRYPVKRTVEDVRYTFAFSEGAKQRLDIQYASNRLTEVQKLTEKGRPIGEGPLKDLTSQTDSLVNRLDNSQLHGEDAQKVEQLGKQQLQVLAAAEPLVQSNATDELAQAKLVSTQVYLKAAQVVVAESGDSGQQVTGAGTASTPTPGARTATPTPEADEGDNGPVEDATPAPIIPVVTPIPGSIVVSPIEGENDAGLSWDLLVFGFLSVEVPSSGGWQLMGVSLNPDGTAPAPDMIRITNADSTAIVVVDPRSGNVYWVQYFNGMYNQYQIRTVDGPIVWQASQDELRGFYQANADVVWHILNTVKAELPTPTPTPTEEPTEEPTATSEPINESGTETTPSP
jgi:hypothetical protein